MGKVQYSILDFSCYSKCYISVVDHDIKSISHIRITEATGKPYILM